MATTDTLQAAQYYLEISLVATNDAYMLSTFQIHSIKL